MELEFFVDDFWKEAFALEQGLEGELDVSAAIDMYREGAEKGHALCQYSLACQYMKGETLKRDPKAAFELYEKAANQGLKLAEFYMFKMYENGEGVELDLNKAMEWAEKLATGADADTQYEVAVFYTTLREDGKMLDAKKSRYWYGEAAKKGHPIAQDALVFPFMWEGQDI